MHAPASARVLRLHRMRLQELDDRPRFGGRKALQGFGVAADV
jgi:hypothetical protein